MIVTLDIPESDFPNFLEVLKPFHAIKVLKQATLKKKTNREEQIEGLREAFAELKLYKEGKVKLTSWEEFKKELEDELSR